MRLARIFQGLSHIRQAIRRVQHSKKKLKKIIAFPAYGPRLRRVSIRNFVSMFLEWEIFMGTILAGRYPWLLYTRCIPLNFVEIYLFFMKLLYVI